MRYALRLAIVALVLVVSGCSSTAPRAEVTAKPTPDELPDLIPAARTIPLNVGVQRDPDEPRVLVVAKSHPPELTPEERAILGEDDKLAYNPLELYHPRVGPAQGIEPSAGRPLAGIGGWGGPRVEVGPYRPPWSVGAGIGGAAVGTTLYPRTLSSTTVARVPPETVGPASPVRVGNRGPERRVAARQQEGNR